MPQTKEAPHVRTTQNPAQAAQKPCLVHRPRVYAQDPLSLPGQKLIDLPAPADLGKLRRVYERRPELFYAHFADQRREIELDPAREPLELAHRIFTTVLKPVDIQLKTKARGAVPDDVHRVLGVVLFKLDVVVVRKRILLTGRLKRPATPREETENG